MVRIKFKYIFLVVTIVLFTSCNQNYEISDSTINQQKEHISIFFGYSDTDLGIQQLITKRVNEEFPNVILEWETVDWGGHFSKQLDAKIASGELPDIIIGKAQDVNKYSEIGILGEFDKDVYENISQRFLYENNVYGIPYNLFYQGVIYNKNIFWRYGIEPPKNISELEIIVDKLNSVSITPFATHFYDNWYIGNMLMQLDMNITYIENPNWANEFNIDTFFIEDLKVLDNTLSQIKYIYINSWEDASKTVQSECINRFTNEEAAMFMSGSWAIQDIYSIQPEMQLGFFPYPNENGTQKLLYEPNLTFMKNSNSYYKDTVDNIIKFIMEDEDLAIDICAFTETDSTMKELQTTNIKFISYDIEKYINENNIIDVNIGNNQMTWEIQLERAEIVKNWLENSSK